MEIETQGARVTGLRCTLCRTLHPEPAPEEGQLYTCPACGVAGILDVEYDYDFARRALGREALARAERTVWRYRPLLPIPAGAEVPPLPLPCSPLFEVPPLARHLGVAALYVKDEGRMPTGSFKDRASSLGALRARAFAAAAVCCSSTGNAASSLAGFCASLHLPCYIFVPASAPEGKVAQLRIFGARVMLVEGSYADAFALSQQACAAFGFYNRNAAINPYLVEGKKTCGLEIAEQLGARLPDWVAVSVGDGCTLAAIWKGLGEMRRLGFISRLPRLLGVQAEGAAPLHAAFLAGAETPADFCWPGAARTLADSIAVAVPRNPVKALRAVRESHGSFITVSDEEILAAMHELAQGSGVFGEPAGVAGLAGVRRAVEEGLIGARDTVLTVVTGSGLKDICAAARACPEARRVGVDFEAVRRLIQAEVGA